MFGRMTILPVLQLNPNSHLEAAVAALLQAAEQPFYSLRLCQAICNRAQFTCSIAKT